MKKSILFLIPLLLSSALFATEFKVEDGQIVFAVAKVKVNTDVDFFYKMNKATNRNDDQIAFATNTVTLTLLTPDADEINLSTCALRYESAEDFRNAKQGKNLGKKIQALIEDDGDNDERIAWLRYYKQSKKK